MSVLNPFNLVYYSIIIPRPLQIITPILTTNHRFCWKYEQSFDNLEVLYTYYPSKSIYIVSLMTRIVIISFKPKNHIGPNCFEFACKITSNLDTSLVRL